jgi:membrane protein implicated in regulation of membrane protease activity
MFKAILTAFFYLFAFSGVAYFVAPLAGFSTQEVRLLCFFGLVLVFGGIIAPALEEAIEKHNQNAAMLIEKEHIKLQKSDAEPIEDSTFRDRPGD